MRKLQECDSRKLYYFRSQSGRRMNKYSGDLVSEEEVREFDIPNWLLEQSPKNKEKNDRQ